MIVNPTNTITRQFTISERDGKFAVLRTRVVNGVEDDTRDFMGEFDTEAEAQTVRTVCQNNYDRLRLIGERSGV